MKRKKVINIRNMAISGALLMSLAITGLQTVSAQNNLNTGANDFSNGVIGDFIVDPLYIHPLDSYEDQNLEWKPLNDVLEVGYNENGEIVAKRNHDYKIISEKTKSSKNNTHIQDITAECESCGNVWNIHRVSDCYFGKGKEVGSKIVYTCMDKNCNNTKSISNPNYKKPTHSSSSRPSHSHYYGEWVYLDDELEANYCPSDNVLMGTRNHSYSSINTKVQSNNDGTHNIDEFLKCDTCGNEKALSKKNIKCNFDAGVISGDKTKVTYTCYDCGYQKVVDYSHTHSEAPENLVYTFKSSNNNGTHSLVGTYNCTTCGDEITVSKDENCDYAFLKYESVGYTNPYNIHNVVEACTICGHEKKTEEACVKTGEKQYVRIYDNIYEYYDCGLCHGYVDRDYHNTHNYGEWEYVDDSIHRRECACGGSIVSSTLPESEKSYYQEGNHNMVKNGNEMVCDTCGYKMPIVLDHEHAHDEMDLMELIKEPYFSDLLSYSQISNPSPSPYEYCSRYDLHCSTCGAYYSIYYAHDFQNGACTRGYCGHIADPSYGINETNNTEYDLSTDTNENALKLERKLSNPNC